MASGALGLAATATRSMLPIKGAAKQGTPDALGTQAPLFATAFMMRPQRVRGTTLYLAAGGFAAETSTAEIARALSVPSVRAQLTALT